MVATGILYCNVRLHENYRHAGRYICIAMHTVGPLSSARSLRTPHRMGAARASHPQPSGGYACSNIVTVSHTTPVPTVSAPVSHTTPVQPRPVPYTPAPTQPTAALLLDIACFFDETTFMQGMAATTPLLLLMRLTL
jgi:hypothetical protein